MWILKTFYASINERVMSIIKLFEEVMHVKVNGLGKAKVMKS